MGARVVDSQYVVPEVLGVLSDAGHDLDLPAGEAPPPPDDLKRAVTDADKLFRLLTDRVDDGLLGAPPLVAIVADVAVGIDNIDLAVATHRGAAVVPVARLGSATVSTRRKMAELGVGAVIDAVGGMSPPILGSPALGHVFAASSREMK